MPDPEATLTIISLFDMNHQKDIFEKAIDRVRHLMEDYHISEKDKTSIEHVIETYRSRFESYNSLNVHSESEQLYMYLRRSSDDMEQRMMLSESELSTPYTI